MERRAPGSCAFFSVSGTGVGRAFFHFFSPKKDGQTRTETRHNGRIRRVVVRQPSGGGATAVSIVFVHKNYETSVDPAQIPDEYIPLAIGSQAPTASAKTAFFDSIVEAEPVFAESLKMIFDVTAGSGAWSFTGYVELE